MSGIYETQKEKYCTDTVYFNTNYVSLKHRQKNLRKIIYVDLN